MKKYLVRINSSCTVEAENEEEAREDVQGSIEESYSTNFGDVPGEIVANATIEEIKIAPKED